MDFLKLNKEFLILQEKLDNYTKQEKKIKYIKKNRKTNNKIRRKEEERNIRNW